MCISAVERGPVFLNYSQYEHTNFETSANGLMDRTNLIGLTEAAEIVMNAVYVESMCTCNWVLPSLMSGYLASLEYIGCRSLEYRKHLKA